MKKILYIILALVLVVFVSNIFSDFRNSLREHSIVSGKNKNVENKPNSSLSSPTKDPEALKTSNRLCQASDAISFKSCANKVNNNQADSIEITSLIACTGKDACSVELKNLKRPVSIYGQNAIYGFRRLDTYNYYLITITNSEATKIYDLSFDENENQPCSPLADPNNCKGTISVSNSNDTSIDNISVSHSKHVAVQVYNSKKIVITNSKFVNSYLFGVVLNSPIDNNIGSFAITSARIENNLFKNIKSNGLVLYQTRATENDPIVIKGNTFINNHRENVYNLCEESGNEPCPGGQLYLTDGVANVKIENNVIKDGGSKIGTGGIEMSANNRNIDILGNDIHNNNMWGIYLNPNPQTAGNILISKNKLYNNGLKPEYRGVDIGNFPPGVMVELENCFTFSCTP